MKRINRIKKERVEEKKDKYKDIIGNFQDIIEGQDEYISELLGEIEKLNKKVKKIKQEK